jgi:flagellar biosynthesis protein FlhF
MHIHRVNGKSLRDALERARALHGEDALVLSHETTSFGVTVAIGESPRKVEFPAVGRDATVAGDVVVRQDPGRADVAKRLARSGASEAFVRDVMAELERRDARGIGALDVAAELLAPRVAIAPSPKLGQAPCVLAFVGPTGVGKTTTLAKLGSRLVRAGRRIALVTTDVQRAGGVEQLGAHAKLLQAPIFVARSGPELIRAVESASGVDAVLLDTAGHSPRDQELVSRLAATLENAERRVALTRYLVLAATASRTALDTAAQTFAVLAPDALAITKLDETREPAAVLELAETRSLPLAFLCDGQDVARDLHRPKPEHVADLFLRGRLP